MSLKVYLKRGAPNYKEKKLVSAIEKAVQEKIEQDASFASTFRPAKTYEELQKLHLELCTTEVSYDEVPDKKEQTSSTEEKHKEFMEGMKNSVEPNKTEEVMGSSVDPFVDANPIVRDYVLDGGIKDATDNGEPKKTTFDEPTTEHESFDMPNSDDEKSTSTKSEGNTKSKKEKNKPEPLNPKFDEMDNGKKKRSTKKFAKLIVEGVCLLAEKGCIWYTTKDITDDKLIEYQLEGTHDMDVLISLEDGQKQPIIEWFKARVTDANTLFKIDETDKQDLIDSLYEVMLEKGIAPTPMQELVINAVKTLILDMGLKAYQFGSQINNVLSQLKIMNTEVAGTNNAGNQHEHTHTHTETTTTTTTDTDSNEDDVNNNENPATSQLAISE